MTSTAERDLPQGEVEPNRPSVWARWVHTLSPFIAVAIFAGVCWLLFRNLQTYRFEEIRRELRRTPRIKIFEALALTALNYLCLAVFDRLAFKGAGVNLPTRKIAAGSLISYAASYNFGLFSAGRRCGIASTHRGV